MANPLKILTQLTASKGAEFAEAVTFKADVAMSDKKITGLAAGTANGQAVRYEQLSTETSRAQSAEVSLSTALSGEASRATSAEASVGVSLSTLVSAEASRAGSAEVSLSTALSGEASRAASAEASVGVSLSTLVSAEASRAASAEASVGVSLSTLVSAEASRAGSAEVSLSTALSGEASRAASAEASVGVSLSTLVSAEASRAASAEASVGTSLSTLVSAEASRAGSAEVSLSTALSGEASRAASAEASVGVSLSTLVSAEASRATSAEASVGVSLSTLVSAEASRAGSAEVSLSTALSGEASRAASAEASVGASLSTLVSAEASRATSYETVLSTSISSEASRATSYETVLSTALSSEASRAVSAEASIATNFLKLDGTNTMTGELKMGNQDIVNAKSGTFNGDLLVKGNLNVSGALTYINTDNLDVKDAKVTIAKGAADLSTAADAGIYIGSDTNPLAKINVGSDGEWLVSGSKGLSIAATGSTESGGGLANFTITNGEFNVEAALRAAFKGLASIDNYNISVGRSYAALRKVESKATDAAGEAIFYLSGSTYTAFKKNTAAGGQPPNGFIDSIGDVAVDVMVLNDDNSYTNDLVSIKVEEHNSVWVKVTVSAPAHANKNVRLIAINEKVNENTLFDL